MRISDWSSDVCSSDLLDEQIRLAWVACELNFSPDAPLAESGPELINRSMTSSRGQLRWLAADRLGPTEQRQEPFLHRAIAHDPEHAGGPDILHVLLLPCELAVQQGRDHRSCGPHAKPWARSRDASGQLGRPHV